MKNRTKILNTLLAVVVGLTLLVCVLVKMAVPNVVLPELDIPVMAALSLAALVLTSFFRTEEKGSLVAEAILAAVTFGVLPWAAGFASTADIWKLALCGGVVFAVLDMVFEAMLDRIEALGNSKIAVIPTAFVLYLACQCFAGWII